MLHSPARTLIRRLRATFSQWEKGIRALTLRKLARLLTGATEPAMPTEPKKPLIVISYAHADEPEHPAEGEVKWLSFVTGYLRAGDQARRS